MPKKTRHKPEPATDLPTWVYRGGMSLAVAALLAGGSYFLSNLLNDVDDARKEVSGISRKVDKVDVIQGEQNRRIDELAREVRRLQR